MSSSSKDQLHTLIEEEEEEEEREEEQYFPPTPASIKALNNAAVSQLEITTPSPSPARHRPMGLSLRPLSLTPESLISAVNGDLPTPSYTPSPKPSGLKSLTLSSSPSLHSLPSMNENTITNISTTVTRRQSLTSSPIAGPSTTFSRRSSLNFRTDSLSSMSSVEAPEPLKRRSSIGYKPSLHTHIVAGLPTPDLTPTSDRRASTDSESDWVPRPLSGNEHQFLYKSQQALLARITDLERVLSNRPRSRPLSSASDVSARSSSFGTSEPSDEMLQLITDLKAERDELKRDVDGWRTRVADMDKQIALLARRVDQERREAWVARERLGLVEVEKRAIAKLAEEKATKADEVLGERDALRVEFAKLQGDVERGKQAEEEVTRLKAELARERSRREEVERELESAGLLATPTPPKYEVPSQQAPFIRRRGLGLSSIDSESSFTDVESVDGIYGKGGVELKAVVEEDEDGQVYFDEEDGLAGYEDEEDSDMSFASPGGSSLGSIHDFTRSSSRPRLDIPTDAPLSVSISPDRSNSSSPSHDRHSSLSKAWSFPAKGTAPTPFARQFEEVDRFFGCLEDLDDSPPSDYGSRSPFAKGFSFDTSDDDELPPFVLPADVGVEVIEEPLKGLLDVVVEEEEPEEEGYLEEDSEILGEEVDGGIRFTFTIPPQFDSPPSTEYVKTPSPPPHRKPVPFYELSSDEDSFSLPQSLFTSPVSEHVKLETPYCQSPTRQGKRSPSSIPRATSLKRFDTPTKLPAPVFTTSDQISFVTPPSQRGGARPSFIPQPSASPLPVSKQNVLSPPTFVPQPQRQIHAASRIPTNSGKPPNGLISQHRFSLSMSNHSVVMSHAANVVSCESPRSCEAVAPLKQDSTWSTSALATRLFTNLLPNPVSQWASRLNSNGAAICMIPPSESASSTASSSGLEEIKQIQQSTPKMLFNSGMQVKPDVKRGFVSKEQQLKRLRLRMEDEWKIRSGS